MNYENLALSNELIKVELPGYREVYLKSRYVTFAVWESNTVLDFQTANHVKFYYLSFFTSTDD